jgi:hypothetical protein
VKFKVSLHITQPPDIGKRKWGQCTKAGHLAQALHWQKTFLPRHFTPEASLRYGHQARKQKYKQRKERAGQSGRRVRHMGKLVQIQRGGMVDNVWSGDLERMITNPGTVAAFPSRAKLTMQGPRYITMRPYKSGQPNKAKELTTRSAGEEEALTDILRFETMRQYMAWKQPKTIQV